MPDSDAGILVKRNDTIPVRPDENFFVEAKRYNGETECLVGSLTVDNQERKNNKPCIEMVHGGDDGSEQVNFTNYRDLRYHTIEGILYHISPTEQEIAAAESAGVTPNIPVNINRSVEFLTKKGNTVTVQYPNFF